jgi:SHS2 domain-containing protein
MTEAQAAARQGADGWLTTGFGYNEIVSPYREVDHTADWALEVWAPTREVLFEDAARGMYALGTPLRDETDGSRGPEKPAEPRALRIELAGDDYESLLVSWLQELLYYTESEGWLFHTFQVMALTPERLDAQALGQPGHRPDKVIKAVTWHNLAIRESADGFAATLVFDV